MRQSSGTWDPEITSGTSRMALQPAAGARDLNPQQVERNHLLSTQLSEVYRLWGFEEVSPPRVERMPTLMAGGAIDASDIVRLVADEPLGLRPEMTASIARAASTRLAQKPRPLRLWSTGTVFESKESVEGGLCIEENLQSGVELFGLKGISAEMELLSLLLDSMEKLHLKNEFKPKLLIGHTSLMEIILAPIAKELRDFVKKALINYNCLAIEGLDISKEQKDSLIKIQQVRGLPTDIITYLESYFGAHNALDELKRLFKFLEPIAKEHNIKLQLDPTFQPHFELYNGLVFQLICQSESAPVVIARGGRYDELVQSFNLKCSEAAGLGFSYAIDRIRELFSSTQSLDSKSEGTLITYGPNKNIELALAKQKEMHIDGERALIEHNICINEQEAKSLLDERGCSRLIWLNS